MNVVCVGLALFEEMTGGSARYLSGMVQALRVAGHDVDVVTAWGALGASGKVESGVGGQARRTVRRLLLVHPRAAAAVIRRRPDVVNVHFAFDGLGAVAAARLLGIPVVVMFQGPWAREAVSTGRRGGWPFSTRIRRFLERRVYRSAKRCIVLSTAFRDLLVEDYGVAGARVRVIPGGIDLAPYSPMQSRSDARGRLGLPDGLTIVTVRRLVPRMGLDLLIEALAMIPEDARPMVAISGIGAERDALVQRSLELGVDDRVRFLGRVPDADLPSLYAAGDLCVVPTRELEGFGYVALEAYAAGTPVVATAVGGLIDLVGGFDSNALVKPEPGALAAGISQSLNSVAADREACRAYAGTFAWSVIGPRVVEVFQEAVRS